MLATQDVCDIEVVDRVPLTRTERLIQMGHGISLMQLVFAKEAADFAATDDYDRRAPSLPSTGFASTVT